MSNQLVITSGAKVRNLEGVLTGTSGVVNSVPLGAANGVATLDSGGKVPVSQLPSSVVTYLGTWDAATNTPTLTNGVGDAGDMYICNVAGTVNFGAGPITFAVGDWVLYGSGTWQKSSGQNGTVTSVAASITGNAIGLTGSPITTAGTLAFAFAGTAAQYINGAGNLVTFPSVITEAQRLITEVYNETGATLTKGTVVYINGGHGNLPTVTKAIATGDATSAQTYGVVQNDITDNNNGYVVVIGSLGDLDTQAYPNGTQLYLSSTTAGAWTSTKQYAPAHLVYVGIVVRSHPTQGVVEVRIQNGFELDELHNVSAQTPSNNQGLFYNSSNQLWENKSIATALGYTPANDASVVHLTGNETIGGTKTFSDATKNNGGIFLQNGSSNSLAGYMNLGGLTDGVKFTSGGGISNSFLLPSATGYSYTFPAASGTVALLEFSQTFSGLQSFTNTAGTDLTYGAYLTKNSIPSFSSSLTVNLYSASGNNNLVIRDNGNTSKLQFQATSSYTYTFPALTGTLAMLEGLQTFSGSKTFSSSALFDMATLFKKVGSPYITSAGYTSLQFTASGTNTSLYITDGDSVTSNRLIFKNNAGYDYTFPALTGTLALTSDLSSYVPYTGATGSVDLGTYGLTAFSLYLKKNGTAGSAITWDAGVSMNIGTTNQVSIAPVSTDGFGFYFGSATKAFYFLASNITAQRVYTLPDANGTIALVGGAGVGTVTSVGLSSATSGVTIGSSPITTSGTITLAIATASGSQQGLLSSTDWTTFNNKQNALTNPVTGTGTTNYLPKFTGTSTIGNSNIQDDGSTVTITSLTKNVGEFRIYPSSGTAVLRFGSGSTEKGKLSVDTSSNMIFETGGYERMRLDASGNLGLGVTPSAWISTAKAFQLGNTAALFAPTSEAILSNNVYVNSSDSNIYITTNYASQYRQVDGKHLWYIAPSGTAGNAISFTQAMTLNASGNLLLGTPTDPGYGRTTASIYNSSGGILQVAGSSTTALFYVYQPDNIAVIGTTTNHNFAIHTNGTQKLLIASTGAATFSNSVTANIITSTSSGSTQLFLTSTNASSRNWQWQTSELANGDISLLQSTTAGGSTYSRIFNLSPTGAATFSSSVTAGGVNSTGGMEALGGYFKSYNAYLGRSSDLITGGSANDGAVMVSGANNLILGIALTERMRITSGGNVLIGTTTDTGYMLRVTGYANIGGNLVVNGDTTIGGLAGTGSRTVVASSTGVLSAPVSDISVKQNIKPIGYGLNEIIKMNPVWFDFIDEYKDYGKGRQNGNIAQEMGQIIPEAVFITPSTGKMGINYDQLHAVYIKAIQEQQAQIQELKQLINK